MANLAVVIKTARAEVARKDAEIGTSLWVGVGVDFNIQARGVYADSMLDAARLRKTVAEAAKRGKA